ncbi:MAG: hypothetical protein Q9P44_03010 [Anaerolineae bacterium]|nr:hypothetical protein [Anaerolineae bacterium]
MPLLRSQQDFANWITPYPDMIFSHDSEALIAEEQIEHIRQVIVEVLSPINNDTTVALNMTHEAEITDTQIALEETTAIATQATGISEEISIQMDMIRRAHALASYLGWLGRGPLMDILGFSLQETESIIAILQARQILERSNTPTPRLRSSSQAR